MAEWLGRGLQNLVHRFDSGSRLHYMNFICEQYAADKPRCYVNTKLLSKGLELRIMKKEIHPKFGPTTITCACGNVMQVGSTARDMHVNVCSACHPFYTGKSSMVDTEGRVEQFNRRYRQKAKA